MAPRVSVRGCRTRSGVSAQSRGEEGIDDRTHDDLFAGSEPVLRARDEQQFGARSSSPRQSRSERTA